MGVISRLPQGGGGGGFIFNITTTESSLFGQWVSITGPEPTKSVQLSDEGKATVKAKKAGTYTFTCGGATYSQDYQVFGEYDVELTLYDAIITVTGAVQLAPPMDSRYIVPDGYYKPNNVDGMQVSLYDGASQIAIPQAFSGGSDTVTFTVDTREHTNVTVKFSDEGAKGFTNPADVPLTLEKGVPASASGTWVEKYAELEVQKMDAELLPFDVILKWGETADEQITWTTDNVSDKSEFICKSVNDYTLTCGEYAPIPPNPHKVDGNMLTTSHKVYPNPVIFSIMPNFMAVDTWAYKDGTSYGSITKDGSDIKFTTTNVGASTTIRSKAFAVPLSATKLNMIGQGTCYGASYAIQISIINDGVYNSIYRDASEIQSINIQQDISAYRGKEIILDIIIGNRYLTHYAQFSTIEIV